MFGLSMCAGIGFTVALFVTSISYTEPALAASAKVGILAGSLLAGCLGYAYLRRVDPVEEVVAGTVPVVELRAGDGNRTRVLSLGS